MIDCPHYQRTEVKLSPVPLMHCVAIDKALEHGHLLQEGKTCAACIADKAASKSGESAACRTLIDRISLLDCLTSQKWSELSDLLKCRTPEAQEKTLIAAVERGMTVEQAQQIAESLELTL